MIPNNSVARRTALISALIASLLIAIPAHCFDLENKVRKHTLKNGLRVLVVERHVGPTLSVHIRYDAGAAYEMNGETGTAHFLEHMMFKGTPSIGSKDFSVESKLLEKVFAAGDALDAERRKGNLADPALLKKLEEKLERVQKEADLFAVKSEIDRIYTENGAVSHNAATGHDMTDYYVSLPANRLELWARIESDRMKNPVFRDFYAERKVVLEERRQSIESNPSRMLAERFQEAAFTVHPYGRQVIGRPDDIANLSAETLRRFFNDHYAPNRAVIAVVGAVSAPKVFSLIEKYFGGIPASDRPRPSVDIEPPQKSERRVCITLDAHPEILIGFHKPTLPSWDDYVFDLIDAVLSDGRTSRLYRNIVEQKGLAHSINTMSGFPGNRFPNLFVFHAKTRTPHTCREIEEAIYEQIEHLKRVPLPASELVKVKNRLRMDFLRGLESNSGIAARLSYYELIAGDYRYITRYMDVIEKITPDDIRLTAAKYFTANNRTVAILERAKKNDKRN